MFKLAFIGTVFAGMATAGTIYHPVN